MTPENSRKIAQEMCLKPFIALPLKDQLRLRNMCDTPKINTYGDFLYQLDHFVKRNNLDITKK
jgi:hypothetical protein